MSEVEIIIGGGRCRRWSAAEKVRIAEERLENRASISVVARRNAVAPSLLYRWRRLMLEGWSVALAEDDDLTSPPDGGVDPGRHRGLSCRYHRRSGTERARNRRVRLQSTHGVAPQRAPR